jgi:radical SAM enzyme (TIGR01210 family)
MNDIGAGDIKKKLNALSLVVIPDIKDEIFVTDNDNVWFPGQGKLGHTSEFREISAYGDMIEIHRLWIEEKLARHYRVSPRHEREQLLYEILVALLTECKLSQIAPPITPSDNWWLRLENKASQWLSSQLIGLIKSKDTRRLLFHIVPCILGINCGQLMEQMKLQFPERSPSVKPDWVKEYLKGDRHTQSWIYKIPKGKGLFLVLYTKKCQYAKCIGCNLHLLGAQNNVGSNLINQQIHKAIGEELLEPEKREIKEVILSNNGSTFDERTLPLANLLYFVSRVSHQLPNLETIIFETRIEYVTPLALKQIKDTLAFDRKNIKIELAVGVELFDDENRNKHYKKGLSLEELEKFAEKIKLMGIKLRCYLMYKPLAGMSREQADDDITKAVAYFNRLSDKYNIEITLHINPTFVAIGTSLVQAFERGEYTPPDLADLKKLLLSFAGSLMNINIYVGLNDEGLAVPGGSFIKPGCERDLERLRKFNFTGDFELLK